MQLDLGPELPDEGRFYLYSVEHSGAFRGSGIFGATRTRGGREGGGWGGHVFSE